MQKLLLFILVLLAIFYVRRWWAQRQEGVRPGPAGRRDEAPREVETMRECAQCGLLVPDSEAVRAQEAYFCCAEHARLGMRRERS
ncbi:MAG: PP0621 family protein [Candidatus Dactylopiibacterium sp.]|nr:PP0621 family protein [Candidatus Dactylopiibacterium sp.]